MKDVTITYPNINEIRFTFPKQNNMQYFCALLDANFPGVNYHVSDNKSCVISKRNVPSPLINEFMSLAKSIK